MAEMASSFLDRSRMSWCLHRRRPRGLPRRGGCRSRSRLRPGSHFTKISQQLSVGFTSRGGLSLYAEIPMNIGIIGAGMIGSTLAKLWVDAGHEVRVASRHPEQLKELVKGLGRLASAGTPMDAAEFGGVVMLTVPLKSVPDLA